MAAAEFRGEGKPKLNEALGWIGSRVDDIYGAGVGRLEDVWIDPGTGVPRWLLVREGRFDGRTTLIPFEDATAGAGHVWVPYEREVVAAAPEVEPGAPLTQHIEAALRTHYAANVPSAISYGEAARSEPARSGGLRDARAATATIRFEPPAEPDPAGAASLRQPEPAPAEPPPLPAPEPPQRSYASPPQGPESRFTGGWQQRHIDPAQAAVDELRALAGAGGSHYVEIELSGELTIRGELRAVRVTPRDRGGR